MDAECVTDVIERCDPSHAQKALRFFVWAGLQRGYRHSPHAYAQACKSLNLYRNPNLIHALVDAYRAERCSVTVKGLKIVLNLCREAKLADEALWVLRKTSEFGLRGDSIMYGVVIRLFCRRGDMNTAERLTRDLAGLGYMYLDMTSLVEMLNGFCRAGRFGKAFELLEVAKRHGCSLNTVLYSSLVNGLCKSGDTERAMELVKEMEIGDDDEIRPNTVTYTSVVQRLCDEGRISEAMQILDRMESRGLSPNEVTANCLIGRLCKDGLVEEARELIGRLVGRGGVSYEKCLSSLVVALERAGRVEEAEECLRKMIGDGLIPGGSASFVVINGVRSAGRVLDGYRLCLEVERVGGFLRVDPSVFSVLLAELCRDEHMDEAAELAKLMLKRGVLPRGPYAKSIMKYIKKAGDNLNSI